MKLVFISNTQTKKLIAYPYSQTLLISLNAKNTATVLDIPVSRIMHIKIKHGCTTKKH
jgi:hypothetical protein